jgi:hypothetical protein
MVKETADHGQQTMVYGPLSMVYGQKRVGTISQADSSWLGEKEKSHEENLTV